MNPEISASQQNLDCHINNPGSDQAGPRGAPLTVGDVFAIECSSSALIFNSSKLKFETKKPYQLQILKVVNQPDGRLQLVVTSYQVGEFKSEALQLSDGVTKATVKGINFKVESVIDKSHPPEGPYGPFGGFILPLPSFYLGSVLIVLVFTLLLVGFKVLRRVQRRRLIQGLKKHDSRLSPQTQLHLRFRQLERQRLGDSGMLPKYLEEVEDILRLFIIRQFKIPAYDWSDRLIINDFQSRFAFLGDEATKELIVLLRETRKARSLVNPQLKDAEQIVRQIKRWADQVDRATGFGRSVKL